MNHKKINIIVILALLVSGSVYSQSILTGTCASLDKKLLGTSIPIHYKQPYIFFDVSAVQFVNIQDPALMSVSFPTYYKYSLNLAKQTITKSVYTRGSSAAPDLSGYNDTERKLSSYEGKQLLSDFSEHIDWLKDKLNQSQSTYAVELNVLNCLKAIIDNEDG